MIQTASMVLRNGTRLLAKDLGDCASRDARLLMAHVLGVPMDRLTVELARTVTPMQVAQFEHMIKRRAKHEPISHITGKRQFWKNEFIVTPDVLDPRPDTESLIELALQGDEPARILDMGTGTGCILLSLLDEWKNASGVGTDLSLEALDVARSNAKNIVGEERVTFLQSNWFENLQGTFDLIVSNPPYISKSEMDGLSKDVRDFEPRLALSDEADGLEAYRKIASKLPLFLTKEGVALFEIGYSQGQAAVGIFLNAGFLEVTLHKDLNGHDRVVRVCAKIE